MIEHDQRRDQYHLRVMCLAPFKNHAEGWQDGSVPAAKPDGPVSTPRSHMVEEELTPQKKAPDFYRGSMVPPMTSHT